MAIDVDADEAKLLAEIGFLGIGRGLPGPAQMVFTALAALRPDQEAAPIGLALTALAQGAPDRAAALLRAAPQTEAVLAFRVLALARLGDLALARELRDELAASGADTALKAIADTALDGN